MAGPRPDATDPLGSPGSAERWARVRALVEAALERPAEERATFLAAECGEDDALRAEVEELLALDATEGLEAPDGRAFEGLAPPAPEDLPRLGPWRLLRSIGAGGMGTVYLGVRADGQFKKRVAVKLIKRGMDTDDVLRRFERERQVLASLDHPGIARLVDGGVSEDGRPYLVLEYVEGEPLDRWCDGQGLSIRERVELLCQVCDAVDDAHRSLVVHRDLKPGNVLVDAQGRPRLLDFGIAKVLDPEKGDQTVDLTATPLRLLTPAYASPEQIRGSAITTASDVYSLGAILYQLLTGRAPLRFETGSAAEVERVVCHEEPTRPSQAVRGGDEPTEALAARRATSPRALCRSLEGDLDTIVAKALRKEPRRRYASAAELAADLRRWLRGLPVSARPDTLGYRSARFVRRNRLAVASAGAVLLALVGGLAASLWQYGRARSAGQELERQLELGRAHNQDLERLNAELASRREAATASRLLAEERAGELERLTAELRAETAAARAAREEAESQRALAEDRAAQVRAFATGLIFDVHRALVPVQGALEARRLVVSTGLSYLDRLRGQGDEDPGLRRELVGAYLRIAEIQGDDAAQHLGDVAGSLATLERAVDLAEQLQAADPESLANDFSLGSALMARGDALRLAGREEQARASFRRAAEVCGADEDGPSPSRGRDYVLAQCLLRLGADARGRGDLEGALGLLDRAGTILDGLAAAMPPLRSDLAGVHFELGLLHQAAGDPEAAEASLLEAQALLEELLAARPGDHALRRRLHQDRRHFGQFLLDQGRDEGALELARELLAEARAWRAATPDDFQGRRVLLGSLDLASRACGARGRHDEALELAEEALEEARAAHELDPASAFALHDLGRAWLRRGLEADAAQRHLDAEDALGEACRTFEELLERDPSSSLGLRSLLAARRNAASTCLELASRADRPATERAQWLRRARGHLVETATVAARLAELGGLLPADEQARDGARADLERCERELEDLDG